MAIPQMGLNQSSYAEISVGTGPAASTVKVWGKIGTLTYLGFTPSVSGELKDNGVDRIVTRKGHRRSRWLGDFVKSAVKENQALSIVYPSKRGSSLPGRPVKIVNMDAETASGARPQYSVQIEGDLGAFIEYIAGKGFAFNAKVIGPKGSSYQGVIAKAGAAP